MELGDSLSDCDKLGDCVSDDDAVGLSVVVALCVAE